MSNSKSILAEQFDTLEQQHEASQLGLWTFLATEIMFFGGLFMAYIVYRNTYPQAFAIGSHHNSLLLGTMNTAVLLTSSLTMALAVRAAQLGKGKALLYFLLATAVLGCVFLGIKGIEYSAHFRENLFPGPSFSKTMPRKTELFFYLYFTMTGLHALHVIVGVGVLAVLAFLAWRMRFSSQYYTPVELGGLYWHFVDIVWVFLYPLMYLINIHL